MSRSAGLGWLLVLLGACGREVPPIIYPPDGGPSVRPDAYLLPTPVPPATEFQPPAVHRDASTPTPPSPSPAPNGCSAGERAYGASCYRLISRGNPMTFDDAVNACAQHGMRVVKIDDAQENAFVYSMLPSSCMVAWIGLRRSGPSTFIWYDGAAPAYVNWASGEPNNEGGRENCVVLWGPALTYPSMRSRWNDDACETSPRQHAICERRR